MLWGKWVLSLEQLRPGGWDSLTDFALQQLTPLTLRIKEPSQISLSISLHWAQYFLSGCLAEQLSWTTRKRLPTSRPSRRGYRQNHSQVESFHQLRFPDSFKFSVYERAGLQCSQCYTCNGQRHSSPQKALYLSKHSHSTSPCPAPSMCQEQMQAYCAVPEGSECYSLVSLAEHLVWKESQKGFYWQKNASGTGRGTSSGTAYKDE